MRHSALSMMAIAAVCAACGSTPSETAGSGGSTTISSTTSTTSTTATTTTSTTGSTTSTTTSTTGTGGTGTCSLSGTNVYANSVESALPACANPVAPLPTEDGTFSVVVFGPFPQAFSLEGFSFLAYEEDSAGVTDPWTATAVVVPGGGDPLAVDPSASAKPYPLVETETLPDGASTYHRYTLTLDAPLAVGACQGVVIALRNTVGPPRSAIAACGSGSSHPETNQWWNLDGTMSEMKSYGANFDRDWQVTLLPAAP